MGTIGTSKSSTWQEPRQGLAATRRFFVQTASRCSTTALTRHKRNGARPAQHRDARLTADCPSMASSDPHNGDGVTTKTITKATGWPRRRRRCGRRCGARRLARRRWREAWYRQAVVGSTEHCEQPAMADDVQHAGILNAAHAGEKPVRRSPRRPTRRAPARCRRRRSRSSGCRRGRRIRRRRRRQRPPPNTTETAAADDTFEVTVPEGVKPGEVLHANTPGGVKVRLRVPEGATPGAVLAFTMPTGGTTTVDAAVKIQAIYRGKTARKGLVEEDAAEVQAAIKVQAITRGYTARFEIEEARRLEWFNYYKLPEVGEYDEALKLACTAEERAEVDAAQEASRVEWVRYYVATGNLSEAKRLLWDGKNPAPPAPDGSDAATTPAPPLAAGRPRGEVPSGDRGVRLCRGRAPRRHRRGEGGRQPRRHARRPSARPSRPPAPPPASRRLSLPPRSGASSGCPPTSPNATSTRRRTRRSSRAKRI